MNARNLSRHFLRPLFGLSASARVSKGQGYQGFLRKRTGSSFGQKRAIYIVQRKNLKNKTEFHIFLRVNKMYSLKF
jgi:hypothetical protein